MDYVTSCFNHIFDFGHIFDKNVAMQREKENKTLQLVYLV